MVQLYLSILISSFVWEAWIQDLIICCQCCLLHVESIFLHPACCCSDGRYSSACKWNAIREEQLPSWHKCAWYKPCNLKNCFITWLLNLNKLVHICYKWGTNKHRYEHTPNWATEFQPSTGTSECTPLSHKRNIYIKDTFATFIHTDSINHAHTEVVIYPSAPHAEDI